MRRRRLSRLSLSIAVAVTGYLLAASPVLAATATLEDPHSPSAAAVDDIYRAVLGVTVTIFVLVGGFILYSAIRFRERRATRDIEPPQMHGSSRLELGWTVVPVLILVGLSAYTFYKLPDVKDVPKGAIPIKVKGVQFAWSYTYPNGKTDSTLVLPVDRPVKLLVTSGDVNHDFWVEELGWKIDAIPGQVNTTWFEPDRTGSYTGQCAEFCGAGHATMVIQVRVVSQSAYQKYLNQK